MATSPLPPTELLDTAHKWVAEDPDPATSSVLSNLLEAAELGDSDAVSELVDAFDGNLEFGTAGLRGRLGPGSNRMNRVVIARVAAGLAAYLLANCGKTIVVGFDARHNSEVFAHDTARIMAGAGLTANILPKALPTPVLAFAIRWAGCDAGVMVTASHNPPEDNGYKVFLGDGSQIVPPVAAEISAYIAEVGPLASLRRSDNYRVLGGDVLDAYVARAVSLVGDGPRGVSAVYTALHGVGGEVFVRVVETAGFDMPWRVAAQFEPDGTFPTVRFPNPEEPGAMDLSLAYARERGADVVIANDPDADRCAVAIPHDGDYRLLTGDEVGALLGWWIAKRDRGTGSKPAKVYAQSIVSGTLLERIAAGAGFEHTTTLTGFKWISKVPGLRFGYEEALGYCVDPAAVRDKDGITASLLVLEMVAALTADGRDLQDVLDDIAREFGLHVTTQLSVRVSDLTLARAALTRLRVNPPTSLGGREVLRVDDFQGGTNGLPPTNGLQFILRNARVIVRPSGTEPKLKCYMQIEIPAPVSDIANARAVARSALTVMHASVAAMLAPQFDVLAE